MDDLYLADSIALNLLRFARNRGIAQSDMLEALGLDVDALTAKPSKSGVQPLAPIAQAYEYIAQKLNDPALGLHLGELYNMAALGIVGQLIQVSRTVGEGVEKACASFNLVSNALRLKLEHHPDRFRMVLEMDDRVLETASAAARHLITSSMVFACRELHFLVDGGHEPRSVSLAFESVLPEEHARVFGCAVTFGAAQNAVEFDPAVLAHPILFADYELLVMLEKEACKRLTALQEQQSTLATQIHAMIYALLDPALPSVEQVAANLNLSARSLQRKLAEENTSYSAITEGIKKELAVSYLKKDLSIKEVSYLMGYNEPSAFVNAFKKWFGKTPLRFRAML